MQKALGLSSLLYIEHENLMNNEIQRENGYPSPLGVSRHGKGLNFALFSEEAKAVSLCLFSPGSLKAANIFVAIFGRKLETSPISSISTI